MAKQKVCEVCGKPLEPQQRLYCKECAKIRNENQRKEALARYYERQKLKKQEPEVKVEAPPTIAEVMKYAKEHGLYHRYGEAVIMMEAERKKEKRNDR